MYENYFFLKLRSLARKTGLLKTIGNLLAKSDYEFLFKKAILSRIAPSDSVYDIGANRGFYTQKFLEKTPQGKVFAFEPVPECNQVIQQLSGTSKHLFLNQMEVGSSKGVVPMSIGTDVLNATSTIKNQKNENDIMVEIDTIDNIVSYNKSVPNVLKIDVEGFELEVIKGMKETLKNSTVQVIAMEIHFSSMEKMGYQYGPKEIVDVLKTNKFRVKWIDASHIIALRGRK